MEPKGGLIGNTDGSDGFIMAHMLHEVPDIQALTVAEIRGMDLEPDVALALRGQELAGKNRKTVLEFLEGLI